MDRVTIAISFIARGALTGAAPARSSHEMAEPSVAAAGDALVVTGKVFAD